MPEQYPPPQPVYAADPNQRSQSPGRSPRFSQVPQAAHGRTYSGSGPQTQMERPPNSRHSSYGVYNTPEYPDTRRSSYAGGTPAGTIAGTTEPSIASLVNVSEPYAYSPPVRPQPGSRPVSQGSLTGMPPPTGPLSRPPTTASGGMGPKTFQEMGVKTNHKKDSDCVVM
jgi:hypothetical protein